MTRTLFISVGGSAQPVRSAIEAGHWERVHFVVSVSNGDKSRSSRPMVEDKVIEYRRASGSDRGEFGPGLRYLPACPDNIAISEVPTDDLDTALARIDAALAAEINAGHQVTVDYTGGTKTMTGAMVLAATAHENINLQFIAGRRADLRQVKVGTESPVEMPGAFIGLARLFTSARNFVGARNYAAALMIMDEARTAMRAAGGPKPPKSWGKRVESWHAWLSVMDAWDRFAHKEALRHFKHAKHACFDWAQNEQTEKVLTRLTLLVASENKPSPALLEDLWLNAERRARLGFFDDAIARLYRLAEASVQCCLWTRHGIDTARIAPDLLTETERQRATLRHDRDGQGYYVMPLIQALELLRRLSPDDELVSEWPRTEDGHFCPLGWQVARNKSILAHGFRPLTQKDWELSRNWFLSRRIHLWENALGRPTASQLPAKLP